MRRKREGEKKGWGERKRGGVCAFRDLLPTIRSHLLESLQLPSSLFSPEATDEVGVLMSQTLPAGPSSEHGCTGD